MTSIVELTDLFITNARQPAASVEILEAAFVRKRVRMPREEETGQIDLSLIHEIIAERCKIPVDEIEQTAQKNRNLFHYLRKEIVGQEKVLRQVADRVLLTKSRLDMRPHRPDGVFLFAGPPGVGKTETARVLARILTGKESGLIYFDASLYSGRQAYDLLVRPRPTDSDSPYGQVPLLEKVRDLAHGVILIDEVEKAHPVIWNYFLRVFEDGRVEDELGMVTDFSRMTIIMTTNLGFSADELQRTMPGFRRRDAATEEQLQADKIKRTIQEFFPAEFLSRIDEILIFRPLRRRDCEQILNLNMQKYAQAIGKRLMLSRKARRLLIKEGFSKESGARELLRVLDRQIGKSILSLRQKMPAEQWQAIRHLHFQVKGNSLKVERFK
ncbi:MAG: AAA family ATPase [candidate division KSB1 bacterium]|nr:AAA family ATPase [candidate division KSB1 bacterium]